MISLYLYLLSIKKLSLYLTKRNRSEKSKEGKKNIHKNTAQKISFIKVGHSQQ